MAGCDPVKLCAKLTFPPPICLAAPGGTLALPPPMGMPPPNAHPALPTGPGPSVSATINNSRRGLAAPRCRMLPHLSSRSVTGWTRRGRRLVAAVAGLRIRQASEAPVVLPLISQWSRQHTVFKESTVGVVLRCKFSCEAWVGLGWRGRGAGCRSKSSAPSRTAKGPELEPRGRNFSA